MLSGLLEASLPEVVISHQRLGFERQCLVLKTAVWKWTEGRRAGVKVRRAGGPRHWNLSVDAAFSSNYPSLSFFLLPEIEERTWWSSTRKNRKAPARGLEWYQMQGHSSADGHHRLDHHAGERGRQELRAALPGRALQLTPACSPAPSFYSSPLAREQLL